jgi:DNA/RNA-binding domain of Phe-tRNA-synthetase-like protein
MGERNHYRLSIEPEVLDRYPGYTCVVTYIDGLRNDGDAGGSAAVLRKAAHDAASRFQGSTPSDHSHIAACRAAYASFGAKPKKYLCSAEALLARVLKSDELPSINTAVNLYNAVSLDHIIPVGGEDRDMLVSNLHLMFSTGKEPFATRRNGEDIVEYPDSGEVVWCDDAGVTCRRWNWRQCQRTTVKHETTRGYFVFDCLPPFGLKEAAAASQHFTALLAEFSPDAAAETEVIYRP